MSNHVMFYPSIIPFDRFRSRLWILRMSAAGQTINDRILAAKHSLAGQVGSLDQDRPDQLEESEDGGPFYVILFRDLLKLCVKPPLKRSLAPRRNILIVSYSCPVKSDHKTNAAQIYFTVPTSPMSPSQLWPTCLLRELR